MTCLPNVWKCYYLPAFTLDYSIGPPTRKQPTGTAVVGASLATVVEPYCNTILEQPQSAGCYVR